MAEKISLPKNKHEKNRKVPVLNAGKEKRKNLKTELRSSVVSRAQESTKQIKEQTDTTKKLHEAHSKDVANLESQVKSPTLLSNPEKREAFFRQLSTPLTTQLVLLIGSKQLDYRNFKNSPLADTISDINDNLSKIRITNRGLTSDEKAIFQVANQLPTHKIPEVSQAYIKFAEKIKSEIAPPVFAATQVMARAQKKRPKPPAKLTKQEKKDWKETTKALANQHPLITAGALGLGMLGAYKFTSWIGGKISSFFTKEPRQSKYRSRNHLTAPDSKYRSAPAPKQSLLWKATKYTAGAALGTFAAGILLDKKSSLGFIGRALESAGIKTNKNRIFRSLTLFSQGVLSLSGRKFLDAWMTLKIGVDQNHPLHDSISSKLDMSGTESHLRYIGHLKYADLLLKDYKISKTSLASQSLGYIPGFLRKYLANEKQFISQERKLRKILRAEIARHKVKPFPGATIDQVLAELDKKIKKDSVEDLSVKKQLTPKEKKQITAAQKKEERQVLAARVLSEGIDKNKSITKKQKEKLLKNTKELLSTATELKKAIPDHWDKITLELHKLGLTDKFTQYFNLPSTAPLPLNRRQKVDFFEARKRILKKFGKKEVAILSLMTTSISEFQTLVSSLKPGKPIPTKILKKFNDLRKRIYSPKGYATTIRKALHNANNATTRDYRKALKTPATWSQLMSSGKKIAYNGLLGTWEYVAQKGENIGINRYHLLTGLIAMRAIPAAWGFIAPGHIELGHKLASQSTLTPRGRIAGAIRGAFAPERVVFSLSKKGLKKAAKTNILPKASGPEIAARQLTRLKKSYGRYYKKAIRMGRPPSKIMTIEKFAKYNKFLRGIGKIAGPAIAILVIEDIASARNKEKALIKQGIHLSAAMMAAIGVGLRTKHPLAAPIAAAITGLAVSLGLKGQVDYIVNKINDKIVADSKREALAKTISETANVAMLGNVINVFTEKVAKKIYEKYYPSANVGDFYNYMIKKYSLPIPFKGIDKRYLNSEIEWLRKVKKSQEYLKTEIQKAKTELKTSGLTPVQKRKLTKKILTLQLMHARLDYQKPKTQKWYIAEAIKYRSIKSSIEDTAEKFAKRFTDKKLSAKKLKIKRRFIKESLLLMSNYDYNYGSQIRYWNQNSKLFDSLISEDEKNSFLASINRKKDMEEAYKRVGVNINRIRVPRRVSKQQREDIKKYYLKLRQLESA